jgi:electron transport complex protein RnfD
MIHLISSPHIHGGDTIRANMLAVMLALVPATMVSIYLFGWLSVFIITLCIVSCFLAEALSLIVMRKPMFMLGDGSAVLTGLLLSLIMPALVPWWLVILACIVAIVPAKQMFGGLGRNMFNPALAAYAVLVILFPAEMTAWIVPMHVGDPQVDLYNLTQSNLLFWGGPEALGKRLDEIVMASPLWHLNMELNQGIGVTEALRSYGYTDLDAFIGREAGNLGETSALALSLGGIYLLARHVVTWHIPVSYLFTVVLLAWVFHSNDPAYYAPPVFHLMAGSLVLCAFFMASDPVTSPVSPLARIAFGIGCGMLAWVIRTYSGYPEGAVFAVLLMNVTVPLLDRYLRPRVYGRSSRI